MRKRVFKSKLKVFDTFQPPALSMKKTKLIELRFFHAFFFLFQGHRSLLKKRTRSLEDGYEKKTGINFWALKLKTKRVENMSGKSAERGNETFAVKSCDALKKNKRRLPMK